MTTTLKKNPQNKLIDATYSHGFESIYAFETIDTSSIRVMTPAASAPTTIKLETCETPPSEPDFDFINNSITPFFLRESIEILKLSSHAERFLRSLGHELIKDVLNLDFNDISFLRGLGQGHIEEIRTKVKEFVRGRSLEHRTNVDYLSWARSLFRGMDKRVVGVVFEHFGLIEHLPLSTAERVEIKKLPHEKKQEWFQQFKVTCRNNKTAFSQDLQIVLEAFVKPWMLARGGFAGSLELRELSWRIGEDREESEKVLALFSELLCEGVHPFFTLKESIIPGIYVAHEPSYKMVTRIVKVLRSYFYADGIEYDLEELSQWVEREFACAWIDLDGTILKRAIQLITECEILQPAVCKRRIVRKQSPLQDHSS